MFTFLCRFSVDIGETVEKDGVVAEPKSPAAAKIFDRGVWVDVLERVLSAFAFQSAPYYSFDERKQRERKLTSASGISARRL
jgi:hypothetical protein